MVQVTFSAEFRGGTFGFVEFKLRRNGSLHSVFSIKGTDSRSFNLEKGLYLVSINGVATPTGTEIKISASTNPLTPDFFPEGPIFRSYVLDLNPQEL
jgi:hypothetical protein